MTKPPPVGIGHGWDPDPGASLSLHADAYTERRWFEVDQAEIMGRSWQWIGHVEKLRCPGAYVTETVAGMPVLAVRDHDGRLRAFFNVCQHRAHELVQGDGQLKNLVCPLRQVSWGAAYQTQS